MVNTLPLIDVFPNPNQPRTVFDDAKLEELAASIRSYGVLEPIVVTPRAGRYMIISGERRYRASLLADRPDIPVRIIEADDALVEELALLENIQRQDLNIIEEARAYKRLLDRGYSRDELAAKLGLKQPWRIDERTALLNLAHSFQEMVVSGSIGPSQAFEMSRLPPDKQSIVFDRIRSGELGTYNKIRSFVNALLDMEKQESIFALQSINETERQSIGELESLLRSVERFIGSLDKKRAEALKKSVFHSSITPERMDLVIQHLLKLRKIVQAGSGIKTAANAA